MSRHFRHAQPLSAVGLCASADATIILANFISLIYTYFHLAQEIVEQMAAPVNQLSEALRSLATAKRYLFTQSDLSSALPNHSRSALLVVLSRAVKRGLLLRVCRGLYLYPDTNPHDGLLLYHAAARLRAGDFNYLSLESALSDAGVISQIPID